MKKRIANPEALGSSVRTVAYARVSSKEQERDGFSVDAQVKLLRQYADNNGMEVAREFQEAESAKTIGRPEFNAMLAFLSDPANDCQTILVEKTDRLYRHPKDWVILEELGYEIHLVKEGEIISDKVHSSTRFLHGIRVLMAKQYIDNLSEEVKKGLNEKAQQGRFPGGHTPLGYRLNKDSGELELDPLREHLIEEMFRKYARNEVSLRGLAAWARSQLLTMPRSGRAVTKCQVERILKNPFYYGDFRWAGKIFRGSHPPIVTRQLFDAVQRAFRIHNKPQLNKKRFPFGSLITCAICGCKITAEIKKQHYTYYHCTGMRGGNHIVYVPESRIVQQFGACLEPLMLKDFQTRIILDNLSQRESLRSKNVERDSSRIRAQLTQLDNWSEKAYIDKLEGRITEAQWQKLAQKWNHEKSRLRRLARDVSPQNDHVLPTAKRVLELMQVLPELWDSGNNWERRELVDLLYSNCLLDGATLCATYNNPFSIIAEGVQSQQKRG